MPAEKLTPGLKAWKMVALSILSLPLFYVLGIGPIFFLLRETQVFDSGKNRVVLTVLSGAYLPLYNFVDESPSLGGKILRVYVRLWISKDEIPEHW